MRPHVLGEATLVELITTAAGSSVFPPEVLEKDLWVVWTLQALYADPDLAAACEMLDGPRRPLIEIDDEDGSKVHVRYPSVLERGAYLRESVLLVFGGRLTIEPTEVRPVRTYLADDLPELTDAYEVPAATPAVVHGARTFWEKVTAIHAFLTRKDAVLRFARSERLSRHWYDLHALRGHDLGLVALATPKLRDAVIRLKGLHFAAPGVDYDACKNGATRLVPEGRLLAGLQRDYEDMIAQGMFRIDDPPPSFAGLIAGIRALEDEVNAL